MLVLYVRRLIHSSLFSSHKSHFCFLLFQTRHFFIFNILLHVTFYVMCFCALPPADIHFVLASWSVVFGEFFVFQWVFGSHHGKGGGLLVVVGGNITLLQKNNAAINKYSI